MSLYLNISQVLERYAVKKSTWYRWVSEGNAPKPTKLGARCVRWKIEDLIKWEASKAA